VKERNRELPDLYPGTVRYRVPDVYCVVDVSESIWERKPDHFFAEVLAAAGISRVVAVRFDDGVRSVCRVKRGMAPRVNGGGTVISPALKLVYGMAKHGDVMVVLSDRLVSGTAEQEK